MMRGGAAASLAVPLMFLLLLMAVGSTVAAGDGSSTTTLVADDGVVLAAPPPADYPRVHLAVDGLTSEGYGEFLEQFRATLPTSQVVFYTPVLRTWAELPVSQRFVLVDLTYREDRETMIAATLAIDASNLYLVGFRVGGDSFFTRDANGSEGVFPGTNMHTLGFTSDYGSLARYAGPPGNPRYRESIELGTRALFDSVTWMNQYAMRPDDQQNVRHLAQGIIVCAQMISEAARFRYIEFQMRLRIDNGDLAPDRTITDLETSWDSLSTAIQRHAGDDGVFDTLVEVLRSNGAFLAFYNARTLAAMMGVLNFACLDKKKRPSSSAMIRLVTSDDDPATCPAHIGSTVRILGSDGLCVDVRDGQYNNGNPVHLWPCKWNADDPNQLWTFASDGTLRSNGKCLASYGKDPANYIMIYECYPGSATMTWHALPNGTIYSASGLVLTTTSSESGTVLSVRDNEYATGQAWLPVSANSKPYGAAAQQIAGVSGLCLHHAADGDRPAVVLRKCAGREEGSWWALYPDSSIRPDKTRRLCLAASGTLPNLPLHTISCDPLSSLQRWLFASDGTLVLFGTDLVVDVAAGGSAVPGARLTLNVLMGVVDTQQWQPLL